MNKKILMLGLAGLLGLSTNVNALETNEKGFPVPDKTNAELTGETGHDDYNVVDVKTYKRPDGSFFYEYYWYNKIGGYTVIKRAGEYFDVYTIEDNNCDGKFETKYSGFMKQEAIPACYSKK